MPNRIDALTAEQALAALQLVYEHLPDELWTGEKPEGAEIPAMVDYLKKRSSDDVRKTVDTLLGPEGAAIRGTVAKTVLKQLDAIPTFHPYVGHAVEEAAHARMVGLPIAIGATLVIVSLLPKITRTADGSCTIEFDPSTNLSGLIQSLAKLVHELPKGLIPGSR
ncbi:MAG: hypothetical protein U0794_01320 [Isosphaeraceae bacterium]